MAMSEVDRERILADRADHKQLLEDEKILSQMVREQRGAVVANGDDDRVSAAAKRTSICVISEYILRAVLGQHTARGATKEKSKKLDELKARRKAKDEKKKVSFRDGRRLV
jgi:RNA polymerase-associated protein RTF1